MNKKVLIATTNPAKLTEIKKFLSDLPLNFVSLKDVGIVQEVIENGISYKENSQKKAIEYAKRSGLPAVADDGGLEIVALGGAPGINSRYWVNKKGIHEDLFEKMKQVAIDIPHNNRKATFRTVISFATPNGKVWSTSDTLKGEVRSNSNVTKKMKGYPYRSFFYIPQLKKYYLESELTEEESKKYNHRYKALVKLKKIIQRQLSI